MQDNKTGGNAFPKIESSYGNAQGAVKYESSKGMTLLDYVAAKAMQSLITEMSRSSHHQANDYTIAGTSIQLMAEYAYKYAASMIEERKKYITQ